MMTLKSSGHIGRSLHRVARVGMLVLVLQFQIGTAWVWANPSGEQVVAGQAGFDRSGSTLTVNQSTNRVVINWKEFSIQQGEVTKFLQPSSSAMALNRVTGGNMSQIYGSLQANGKIILINPNGMVFGSSGMIDVGSFVGSTLDLSNDVFMKGGEMQFVGDSENAIQNFGKIQAADNVFLFAQKIDNQGKITAGGEAALAAGSNILLKQGKDNRVSVLVGSSDQVTGDGIRNSGEVQAAMVTMKATGSAYSAAVNNEGLVRATGAAKVGGRVLLTANGGNLLNSGTISAKNANGTGGAIKLQAGTNTAKTATVTNSGTLDATGTTGGRVEVTGDRVALTGQALVDVSGTNGGGTALIGGSYQGKEDASVQNASRTFVGAEARIKADAVESGNGGEVVVWSDNGTQFYGDISARGGAQSGDGGQVEVSGRDHLDFRGTVSTLAANGSNGSLLLDPTNLTIDNTADNNVSVATPFAPTGGASVLTWTSILAALTGGDVTVTTTVPPGVDTGVEVGNITIAASPAGYNSANDLTFTTAPTGGIFVNADIVNAGFGGITFNAGSGGINLNTALIQAGDLTFNSSVGGVNLVAAAVQLTTQGVTTGSISFGANTTTNGASTLNMTASGDINFSSGANVGNTTALTAVNVTSANTLTLRNVTTTGEQRYGSVGNGPDTLNLNGNLVSTGAGGDIIFGAAGPGSDINILSNIEITVQSATDTLDLFTANSLNLGTNQLTLTSDDINLPTGAGSITGNVASKAVLVLQGTSAASSNLLTLSSATLVIAGNIVGALNTILADDEFQVIIGRTDATANTTFGSGVAETIALDNRYVFRAGNLSGSGDILFNTNTLLEGIATGSASVNSLEFRAGVTGGIMKDPSSTVRVGPTGTGVGGLLFSSNTLNIAGANSIQTAGNITFQPSNDATSIGVNGGAGTFSFTNFSLLQPGFASLTIGSTTGTGTINVNAGNFTNSTTIQSGGGGIINVNGALTGSAGAFLSLNAGTGTINLNNNIVTSDAAITLSAGTTNIAAVNVLIDSTNGQPAGVGGGDITIDGNIVDSSLSTTHNLTINSGTQAITVNGVIGTTANNRLNIVTLNGSGTGVDGKTLNPVGAVAVRANQFITNNPTTTIPVATGETILGGNILTFGTGAAGGITFNDNVVLNNSGTITLNTLQGGANNGDLLVQGTIRANNGENLTVQVGTGSATFNGQIGQSALLPLGNLSVSSDDVIEFNADVFANAVRTLDVLGTGVAGTTRIGGNITTFANNFTSNSQLYNTATTIIDGADVNLLTNETNIRFVGTVEGDVADTNDLTIDSGSGTIRFDGAVGQTVSLGDVELVNNNTTANQGIRIASDWRSASLTTSGTGVTRFGGGTANVLVSGSPATQTIATTTAGGQTYGTDVQVRATQTNFDSTTGNGDVEFQGTLNGAVNLAQDVTVTTGTGDAIFRGQVGTSVLRIDDLIINSQGSGRIEANVFVDDLTTDAGGFTVINNTASPTGIIVDTRNIQTYNDTLQVDGSETSPSILRGNTGGGVAGAAIIIDKLNGADAGTNDLLINANNAGVTFRGGLSGGNAIGDVYVINASQVLFDANAVLADNVLTANTFAIERATNIFASGGEVQTQGTASSLNYQSLLTAEGVVATTGISGSFGAYFIATDTIVIGQAAQVRDSRVETLNTGRLRFEAGNDIFVNGSDGSASSSNGLVLSDGRLDFTATDDIVVAGGTGTAAGANGVVQSNGNMFLTAADITVSGGSGSGDFNTASVVSLGTQTLTALTGNIIVTGGSVGDDNSALVQSTGLQTVNVDQGNFNVLGGTLSGNRNSAAVNALAGQTVNVLIGNMNVQGGGGGNTSLALVSADGQQTININTGNLLVAGGDTTGGANTAQILKTATGAGNQDINVAGDMRVRGGASGNNNATARVTSEVDQDIDVGAVLFVNGGNGTGNNSRGIIEMTGLTNDQQVTADLVRMAGGAGAGINANALITSANTQTVAVVNAGNNAIALQMTGGTGAGTTSSSRIQADSNQTVTVAQGDIVMQGGTQLQNRADIENLSGDQVVEITGTGDLLMTGGTGEEADVRIRGINNAQNQTITLADGNLVMTAGVNATNGGDALIRLLNAAGILQRVDVDGTITLNGAGGGTAGDAQIFANSTDQEVMATGTIQLNGGGAGSNNNARIRMENALGDQLVQSDANIDLNGGAGGTNNDADILSANTQIIIAGTGLTLDGGAGNTSDARILADDTQSVTATTGDIVLTGGNGANADALIRLTNTTPGSDQTITVSTGNLVISGNQDSTTNNSDAFIEMLVNDIDALQTINVVQGSITLTSGAGNNELAFISSEGNQDIDAQTGITVRGYQAGTTGNDSFAFISQNLATGSQTLNVNGAGNLTVLGGSGTNDDASITSAGIIQTITVTNGNLLVTGNQDATNANSDALIDSTNNGVTQTINVSGAGAGTIQILGGAGTTETAGIRTNGIQAITAANGISVSGGSGQDSTGFIVKQGDDTDSQTITVTTGDLNVLGGTGVNADANVTSNGLAQTINVNNGVLRVQGDQTNAATANADALISLLSNASGAAVQTLNVTNGGIVVQGGVGGTENATINMLDDNGRQTINLITDGDFLVEGGNGSSSAALVTSAGLDAGAGTEAQRIIIDAGQLIVRGNQDGANNNGTATISQTNTGAASQIITINGAAGTDGLLTIEGGDGTSEIAQILSNGTVAQNVTIARGLVMLGGNGNDSTALLTSTGTGQTQTVTVTTGDASLTGGTADNTQARIEQTNASGTQIILVSGTSALSNLSLLGGDGTNADAAITAAGTVQTITVTNGNLLVTGNQDATNANSDALIDSTNNGVTQTINVSGAGAGTIQILGGAGTAETAGIRTNGIQAITAANGISVTGGSGQDSTGFIVKQGDDTDSQTITVTTGDFNVLGGTGVNADANVTSNGLAQTINVNNGVLRVQGDQTNAATANANALISLLSNASGAAVQTLNVTNGGIIVQGGVGDTENATINMLDANGRQTLNAITAGNISVLGGSGAGSNALVSSAGTGTASGTEAQRIVIDDGNLIVTGGSNATTGGTALITATNTGSATQAIQINGATNGLLLINGGSGNGADAGIRAAGFNAANGLAQTITALNGALLRGGTDATSGGDAFIETTGLLSRQLITITNNDLELNGGTGTNAAARITAAGRNGGAATQEAQRIIISNGDLRVLAFDSSATNAANNANNGSTALINTTNTDPAFGGNGATQFISVSGSATVQGGFGANETASIASVGRGGGANALAQQLVIGDDLSVLGGGDSAIAGSGNGSSASITNTVGAILAPASAAQSIAVTNDLLVQGGYGNNASALISSNRNQTVTVGGTASLIADNNADNGGGSATISQTLFLNITQTITVNGAGANALQITGGAATGDSAAIDKVAITGAQNITVANGGIVLDGGSGGAVTDNYARIRSLSTGSQSINWDNDFNLVLNANQGASNDAAVSATLTNYGAAIASLGVQNIGQTNGGGILVNGGSDDDAVALIGSALAQNITSRGVITVTGGSDTNTSAQIRTLTTQTINAGGLLSVLGNNTAAADNFAVIRSGLDQTITVTAGGLVIDANRSSSTTAQGSSLAGFGAGIVTSGNQLVDVQSGTIQITGGDIAGAVALIELNSALPGATNQTVRTSASGTSINLNDGTGDDAAIISNGTSANGQVITSVTTTNLSGVNGNQSLIQGVNTILNNVGGTWAGAANVVSSTQASVNNTGALVIDESSGFTGGVTTPLLRFFGGTATVGSTTDGPLGANTRLNTFVNSIFFDSVGAKTVNISEDNTVDLRGTVGTVNLITMNAGDITTNTSALTATNATFQTFDGDIDLDGVANNVANFRGIIARDDNGNGTGGSFRYLGASSTTVRARAVSAEIAAGQDIFADNTITMAVGGNTIFLAGGTKTGGTAPGAGDGRIFSGSNQNYNSAVVLSTDYEITSDGSGIPASNLVNFNSTLNGPGGLTAAGTPNFNANIGGNSALAYLVLNATNSFFNAGFNTATINGSFINNGTMTTAGATTFIVDNGTLAAGPGLFTGGTMVLGGAITIYGGAVGSVTGSAIPATEVFDAWTGSPFNPLVPFAANTIFYKDPNPFEPADPFNKNRLVKRRVNVSYEVAYRQGGLPAAYYGMAGLPDVPNNQIGGLMSSSYEVQPQSTDVQSIGFTDLYQTR